MLKSKLSDDGRTVTVRVPISIRRRDGRRLVLTPDGTDVTTAPSHRHIDSAMVKVIARAFRWREMLENGEYGTILEISNAEKINATYVDRVLRLTLLAPEIVEVIVKGRQPAGLQLHALMRRFPIDWQEQAKLLARRPKHFSQTPALGCLPMRPFRRHQYQRSRGQPADDLALYRKLHTLQDRPNRLESTWKTFRNQMFPIVIDTVITAIAVSANHK